MTSLKSAQSVFSSQLPSYREATPYPKVRYEQSLTKTLQALERLVPGKVLAPVSTSTFGSYRVDQGQVGVLKTNQGESLLVLPGRYSGWRFPGKGSWEAPRAVTGTSLRLGNVHIEKLTEGERMVVRNAEGQLSEVTQGFAMYAPVDAITVGTRYGKGKAAPGRACLMGAHGGALGYQTPLSIFDKGNNTPAGYYIETEPQCQAVTWAEDASPDLGNVHNAGENFWVRPGNLTRLVDVKPHACTVKVMGVELSDGNHIDIIGSYTHQVTAPSLFVSSGRTPADLETLLGQRVRAAFMQLTAADVAAEKLRANRTGRVQYALNQAKIEFKAACDEAGITISHFAVDVRLPTDIAKPFATANVKFTVNELLYPVELANAELDNRHKVAMHGIATGAEQQILQASKELKQEQRSEALEDAAARAERESVLAARADRVATERAHIKAENWDALIQGAFRLGQATRLPPG